MNNNNNNNNNKSNTVMSAYFFTNRSYINVLLTTLLFVEMIRNVESESPSIVPEPLEDWVKIQNWELVKDDTTNNTLYNYLTGEELSDCFQMYSQPNIMKFRCYSRYNIFEMTTLFCVVLSDGYICM